MSCPLSLDGCSEEGSAVFSGLRSKKVEEVGCGDSRSAFEGRVLI